MAMRHYLITGAGRGIGRGLSRLLLQKGHRVLLVDNNDEELGHVRARLARTLSPGISFETIVCDLRNHGEIQSMVQRATQFFGGRLDCLVNNAAYTGGVGGLAIEDMTLADWQASMETNLTAPMLVTQACLPLLRRESTGRSNGDINSRTSSVVHMSSTRAFMAETANEPYSATKAGLLGLSQALAVSLGTSGIRSNVILPGWIHAAIECKKADLEGTTWETGLSEQDHRWHLTGRVGKVQDVLTALEYLVEAEFVTGAELVVDGGVTRKMVYPEDEEE